MKNQILVGLTIMTLMFAGCSMDEVSSINNSDANSIGFELSTGKTRAELVDIEALYRNANGFGVFATNGASPATYIDNEAYKYENGAWKWAAISHNWPEKDTEYPVNFYAYFPADKTTLTTPSLAAQYTIAESPAQQVDYLAANSVGVTSKPVSGDVLLKFNHILSKIDFKVITGSNVTVEVQSIAVRNVGNTGTFSFQSLLWASSPAKWEASFSYLTAPVKDANKFAGRTDPKGADVSGSSGSLMLMPQNLSGRSWYPLPKKEETLHNLNILSYIEVVYRVYETGNKNDLVGFSDASDHPDYTGGVTGPLFVKVGYPLPTNWEMGKAYTYTIHIGDGSSSGGNLIEKYFIDRNGEKTTLVVVYPGTNKPIEPPDPIFPKNNVIGFVVSVEDWNIQIVSPLL